MAAPAVITKAIGHVSSIALAGDLRYLCELESRGDWQVVPLTPDEIKNLIGKHRKLFTAEPGGLILRLPPETMMVRGKDGVLRMRRTGTISEAYADQAAQLQAAGKVLFQRIVIGIKPILHDHGYRLERPHGFIVPLTWTARLKAQEMGWLSTLRSGEARSILSRVLRQSIRSNQLTSRAVRTITSSKKVGRVIAAHNLVIAPHPRLLEQIRRSGQAVDQIMEAAARRALEKMERRIGRRITAVASTHLCDSTGVRPHLHVRLSAYDSNGKYVKLFDRATGGGGGNRCILQSDIEQEMQKIITRWEPRERD